jgi:mannose-6-phosphate isomerase
MPFVRLERRLVAKPWGRRDVPDWLGAAPAGDDPLGEIWFVDPDGAEAELLVKYLLTSEKLSIQVHPDDAVARAAGHARGKDEAWLVLKAEPDAVIGLGLTRELSREALREAAHDGSIEQLVDWRPVKAGDCFYSPAGTIHALGPGLVVVEIQQNIDLTYRLYDYGRPRELHLDAALAAADPAPWRSGCAPMTVAPGRERLASGPAFTLERWRGASGMVGGAAPAWLVPLAGESRLDGDRIAPGSAWRTDGAARLEVPSGAELLVACASGEVRPAAS